MEASATLHAGSLPEKASVTRELLGLAVPTIAVLVVQTFVGVAETYYVGRLGTDALAGAALVSPVLMLMTMMSNGGIGGGVASAVARALGARRRADAEAIAWHALLLGVAFGAVFTSAAWLLAEPLYRLLGGEGEALRAANLYSTVVFTASVPIWIVNLLSAALRGAGDVKTPAKITLAGAAVVIPLSPLFIFGAGGVRGLGIAGAGVAVGLYYVGACTVLVRRMSRGGALRLAPSALRADLLADVLSVGGPSAAGTLVANLTVVVITGAAAAFSTAALAGYGVASRLDTLLIPLLFGLGSATVTLVGRSVGAGDAAAAKRVAWIAAAYAAAATGGIGLVVAVAPGAWMSLFTSNAAVQSAGAAYLRIVGPAYAFVGAGMLLYFASQGAGRVLWPFVAGTLRLLVAAGLGSLLVHRFHASLETLFAAVASGSVVFGAVNVAAAWRADWSRRHASLTVATGGAD